MFYLLKLIIISVYTLIIRVYNNIYPLNEIINFASKEEMKMKRLSLNERIPPKEIFYVSLRNYFIFIKINTR